MLRITRVSGSSEGPTLKLEGKLVGPWVEALREAAAAEPAGLCLDLAAVSYADPTGVRLLRELLAGGFTVMACTGLVAELLHGEVR